MNASVVAISQENKIVVFGGFDGKGFLNNGYEVNYQGYSMRPILG